MLWQLLFSGADVQRVGIFDESFVALQRTGRVMVSKDGIEWENRATLPHIWNVLFREDSVVICTEYYNGHSYVFEIHTTRDLENFELSYSTENSGHGYWLTVVDVGDYLLAVLYAGNDKTVFYSGDGSMWTPVLDVSEIEYSQLSRAPNGTVIVQTEFSSPSHPKWVSTVDGQTWEWHNLFLGNYVSINEQYVGVDNGRLYQSYDAESWELNGPEAFFRRDPIKGNGRVVLISETSSNVFDVYTTIDGTSWTTVRLPPVLLDGESISYLYGLVFYDGAFWIERTATYPPFLPPRDDLPDPECLRSVDGVSWEAVEKPERLINEGEILHSQYEAVPDGTIPFPKIYDISPVTIIQDEFSAEIKEIPEGERYGLYQSVASGEEQVVMSNWGMSYYWGLDYPYVEPRQLLGLNGRFLCLNRSGYLAVWDPGQEFLEQPYPRFTYDSRSETSIKMTWDPAPGAEVYQVFRYSSGENPLDAVLIGENEEPWWIDNSPELQKYVEYFYFVSASNAKGISCLPSFADDGYLWSLYPIGTMVGWGWGWLDTEFMGYLYFRNRPWTWTYPHGWWYLIEVKEGFWAWDSSIGWLWSQRSVYPFLYDSTRDCWLYSLNDIAAPRWFYDYSIGEWRKY